MMICHATAFAIGFITDIIIGDPHFLPHPIKTIGKLIELLEKLFYREGKEDYVNKKNLKRGRVVLVLTVFITAIISFGILYLLYYVNKIAGVTAESIMTWQILSVKSLKTESMKVFKALEDEDVEKARYQVSMLVSRDTKALNREGIIRSCVETVAENTCDGIVGPMLFLALGGPVLGFAYKAVSTLDSMIGYKNERYLYFGRASAITDDILNFLPARMSALLMILSSAILALDTEAAVRIYKRDSRKTESPNAGQTEAVCAGALGVALGGESIYFGKKVSKAVLGDRNRQLEASDIRTVNEMALCTAVVLCLTILIIMSIIIAAKEIWL